jgi:ankyrin repeat protein
LTHAAAKGQLEIVKILVAHGADVHATNHHGLTPLALARKHGRPEVTAFLMQYAPD